MYNYHLDKGIYVSSMGSVYHRLGAKPQIFLAKCQLPWLCEEDTFAYSQYTALVLPQSFLQTYSLNCNIHDSVASLEAFNVLVCLDPSLFIYEGAP